MRRAFVVLLVVMVAAPACNLLRKQEPAPQAKVIVDEHPVLDKGYPGKVVRETPVKAETPRQPEAPTASPQATAEAVGDGTCDQSTVDAAFKAYARLKGFEPTGDAESNGCFTLIEDLDCVLTGSGGTGAGCFWNEVMHGCKLYATPEASTVVLQARGWANASGKERARLALIWVTKVSFATAGVIQYKTKVFDAKQVEFRAPEAAPKGKGAKVTLWVQRAGYIGQAAKNELHEVTFDAKGAIASDEVKETLEVGLPTH